MKTNYTRSKNVDRLQHNGYHEPKEVGVVPPTYARAQPHTVVVKLLNTVLAEVAMSCSRGPKNSTGFTILKSLDVGFGRAGRVYVASSTLNQVKYSIVFVFDTQIAVVNYRIRSSRLVFDSR
jgi:hypothetical protein